MNASRWFWLGGFALAACATDAGRHADSANMMDASPLADASDDPSPPVEAPDAALMDANASLDASAMPEAAVPSNPSPDGSMAMPEDAGDDAEVGPVAPPPKTHAELCPAATVGVGIPVPIAGASPEPLHPLVDYFESTIAEPHEFGLVDARQMAMIENQPEDGVLQWSNTLSTDAYSGDLSIEWPAWLQYTFDGARQTHEVRITAGALTRGTYYIRVPVDIRRDTLGGPFAFKHDFNIVVRVEGLAFMAERLPFGHYYDEPLDRPLQVSLAGADSAWRITDVPTWLRVSQLEGELPASLTLEVWREPLFDTLAPGRYEGRLCVENERGDAHSIPVYAVIEPPRLRPLHSQRYLYNFASAEQLSSFIYVFTDRSEQVAWQGASSEPWLRLDRASGMTNERIGFSVDPTGLPEGHHTAELSFSDPTGRNEGTQVIVHYLKDGRLSSWRNEMQFTSDTVSPISPHAIRLRSSGVSIQNVFTDERASVSAGDLEVYSAAVSAHSQRLYVRYAESASHRGEIRSYSWPELVELDRFATDAGSAYLDAPVVTVLGDEYWPFANFVVSLADGRSGPITPATASQRTRLRIYDDGTTLFGFREPFERVGQAPPLGGVHWARSPRAVCNYEAITGGWSFQCEDETGTYLTATPQEQPSIPLNNSSVLFTHQGGVYLRAAGSSDPDYAFDASGAPITPIRFAPIGSWARQWGDTILIGDMGGQVLNHLFEPGPAATPPAPLPPSNATCPAAAGQLIASVSLNAAALVADPLRDRLYAVVRADASSYASELVTLSGSTGAILDHRPLGGAPMLADLTFDGSMLWVVFGTPTGDTPNGLLGVDLSGDRPVLGSVAVVPNEWDHRRMLYASDMAIAAGTKDTVAIALRGTSTGLTALYIGGVLRDISTADERFLEEGPFGYFFGAHQDWFGPQVTRVIDRHLHGVGRAGGSDGGWDMVYQAGHLFASIPAGIEVIDVRDLTAATTLAILPTAPAVLPEVSRRRVWTLRTATDPAHSMQLVEHDMDSWTGARTTYLDSVSRGYPYDFVRTASGCFAYRASASSVVLFSPPR